MKKVFIPLFTIIVLITFINTSQALEKRSSIAMHGEPKYKDGFTHFNYVNPNAPQGGNLKLHSIGGFDNLNAFSIKGNPVVGIGLVYDTLTTQSEDEPFTQYGLLAESFEVPEDRSYIIFHLHPKAKFSDGTKVTAEDVHFSFYALIEKASPMYRQYYSGVKEVVVINKKSVRFNFKPNVNRELALIIGQLNILPKHFWKDRDFSKPTTDKVIGSGPYIIEKFEVNKYITYKKNKEYWGNNLPVNKGRYNFNSITYDYYRDQTVALEAFKSGNYGYTKEYSSKSWANEYKFPAVKEKKVIVEEVDHGRPTGMQAFVFNIRKDIFKDKLTREALSYAFDFEWSNSNLFFGAYKRSNSFFSNSKMASSGTPSKNELALLNPLKKQLPKRLFTEEYQAPKTDGSGKIRKNLKIALQLLRRAGWTFEKGKLVDKNKKPLTFEILIVQSSFERIINPFKQNLAKVGIDINIRLVDDSQYINRIRKFDFDMIVSTFGQSLSPGNEQLSFWGSASADLEGSRNIIGIKNKAIDQLIENVISAPDNKSLITATKALDRALLWNFYVIPQWHVNYDRIAYWNYLHHPKVIPESGISILNFWYKKIN